MTLTSQNPVETKLGNGVSTTFPFTFIINKASDLIVTHTNLSGVDTILTEGVGTTNYSVIVLRYPGAGEIIYPTNASLITSKLLTGERITLSRQVTLNQKTDLINSGAWNPSQVESAFDYGRMIDLQQQNEIDRSLKTLVSDNSGADYTVPLPIANTIVGGLWDSEAKRIVPGPTLYDILEAGTHTSIAGTHATSAQESVNAARASARAAAASATTSTNKSNLADASSISSESSATNSLDSAAESLASATRSATSAATATTEASHAAGSEATSQVNASAAYGHRGAAETSAISAAASATLAQAQTDEKGYYKTVSILMPGDHNIETSNEGTYYICASNEGVITVNLPAIGTNEAMLFGFERAGSNSVTIISDGADRINGAVRNYDLSVNTEVVQFLANDAIQDSWIAGIQSQTLAGDGLIKVGSTISLNLTAGTGLIKEGPNLALDLTAGTGLIKEGPNLALDLEKPQTWGGPQRAKTIQDNDGIFDLDDGQNFKWTPTSTNVLGFVNANRAINQVGVIFLSNPSGFTILKSPSIRADEDFLTTVSTAGTYLIGYYCDGVNMWITHSGALSA